MNIINTVTAKESELVKLLGDYENTFVGYVYSMRFNEVLILTNDKFKKDVKGIPHNSFLVAAGFDPNKIADSDNIDQEIILLRVLEPASLPQDRDYIHTIIEHHQKRTRDEKFPDTKHDGYDPITASELQAGGLRCSILGTFYIDKNHELRLGSDVENFMSLSRLRVYKPKEKSLENIINHVNPEVLKKAEDEAKKVGFKSIPSPIIIGTVRYTSTDRLHRNNQDELVDVKIQPTDFLARRTAVLGMTRTGKSNTIKTTVAAVALSALRDNVKIGQLIFDINGEYANATHQDDGSSIADVFSANTIRYRAKETNGFEDLRINFYESTEEALNLIQTLFKNEKNPMFSGQDIETFMSSSLYKPEQNDRSAYNRWEVLNSAFQCILNEANYVIDKRNIKIPTSKSLLKQINAFYDQTNEPKPFIPTESQNFVSIDEAKQWFKTIRFVNKELKSRNNNIGLESSTKGKSWVDPELESFLNILVRKNNSDRDFGGYKVINKYKEYHSSNRTQNLTKEIVDHLNEGKIVILDLSVGPVEIRTTLSERIARQIFDNQMNIFHNGDTPNNMVLYVEEAHNLIGKKEELTNTWPRIAKEGAKAKIAFVYATQEPSSIHPNILANTENWFVTHLNNDDELRTLAKFYDFHDFIQSLKNAQDVGFARIKTLSSPFVIPTQINRFTPESLKQEIDSIKQSYNAI